MFGGKVYNKKYNTKENIISNKQLYLKKYIGIVYPKMKISEEVTSFNNHPKIVSNLYDILSSMENYILNNESE